MRRSSAKRRSEQQRCTVTGTRGADTPLGTGRDDVICGLGGADALFAADGVRHNDIMVGGAGKEQLPREPGGRKEDLLIEGAPGAGVRKELRFSIHRSGDARIRDARRPRTPIGFAARDACDAFYLNQPWIVDRFLRDRLSEPNEDRQEAPWRVLRWTFERTFPEPAKWLLMKD